MSNGIEFYAATAESKKHEMQQFEVE